MYVRDRRLWGLELDWIAHDRGLRIGYFMSAGSGQVPAEVAAEAEAYRDVLDEVLALDITGEAVVVQDPGCYLGDMIKISRRGLFCFNFDARARGYSLITLPSQPRLVGDLTVPRLWARISRCALETRFHDGRHDSIEIAHPSLELGLAR